jgi:deoxyribonuclease IV
LLLGAQVPAADPGQAARDRDAEVVQVFLSAPQQWRPPTSKPPGWREGWEDLPLYVHAAYLVNLASASAETRERSVANLQATLDAASHLDVRGVVVHAGQAGVDSTVEQGIERFIDGVIRLRSEVPLLIENTATGLAALGRSIEAWEALFAAIDRASPDVPVGVCVDTCHLWCGTDWADPSVGEVARLMARFVAVHPGGLLHVNGSRDPAGAGRDRHARVVEGDLPSDHLVAMIQAATSHGIDHAVVETPGKAPEHAADLAWLREQLQGGPGAAGGRYRRGGVPRL